MTENKRFRLGYVCGDYGLIDNDEWIDLHSMSENSEKNVKLCINKMNELAEENEQLKQQLKLEEAEERINCRNCIYFISGSSSDSCLKREDIGYKGTCIDGMDYHYLAKNCPYY